MGVLEGQRILVVGASRGLGQAFVRRLLLEGSSVVAAARTLSQDLPSNDKVRQFTCDVRDPSKCVELVASAVDHLGALDALIYAPGVTVVTELQKASAEHWHTVLETNVVGAGLITASALPHLESSEGVAIYLSSVSAHVTPPWVGMGLYAASKVALEKCVEVWKLEHPRVRFSTIVIGSTTGTSFFASAEKPRPDDLERFQDQWRARGYLAQESLSPEDQADAVVNILTSRAQIDVMWVRPRTLLQLWE